MKEEFLHFVWLHRLWPQTVMHLTDGRTVEILDPGLPNHASGPDFFNAKIRLDGNTLAGNVEIHIRASDWHRHGHHTDPAYDSVILHVVNVNDRKIQRTTGSEIPTVLLTVNPQMQQLYEQMMNRNGSDLPCAEFLRHLPSIYLTDWITALAHERLYSKSERATAIYRSHDKDWGATAFIILARALGFSTNSEPMERMASSVPFNFLRRHSDDIPMLEAFIFGQAGLTHPQPDAESPEAQYFNRLRQNYTFLAAKYGLEQPHDLNWKFAGARPQNSPWRRLALLAQLSGGNFPLAACYAHITGLEQARELFRLPLQGFWATHYTPIRPIEAPLSALGESAIDSLVINVIIPLLHAYGQEYVNDAAVDLAIDLLQSLPPEDNSLTRIFTVEGVECDDAFTSQALIHLRRNYCEPRKCLYCRIGHRFLSKANAAKF